MLPFSLSGLISVSGSSLSLSKPLIFRYISMAKLQEQDESYFSKENMKNAMLKHEHTFRHQVYELHRLYRIQKLLMKNITEENRAKTETWAVKNEDEDINFIEENEIELTLGPSSYRRRIKRGGSDSGMSFSSSSSTTGSAQKSRHFYKDGEFVNPSQMGFVGFLEVEDEMRLSHNHPNPNPWLYHVVSLNLT